MSTKATATTNGAPADASALLLSQSQERFQSLVVGGNRVALSALDVLPVGVGTDFGSDFRAGDSAERLYLFAEEIVLSEQLSFNGGVVSAHAINAANSPAVLDIAGTLGTTNEASPGGSPQPAGPGTDGGSLGLYLEEMPLDLRVDARGGQGGAGQSGTETIEGGDGGPGGTGGEVVAIIPNIWQGFIASLLPIYKLSSLEDKLSALKAFISAIPSTDLFGNVVGTLQQAMQDNATLKDMNDAMFRAMQLLQNQADLVYAEFGGSISVIGGLPGVHGSGKKAGSTGAFGDPGTKEVVMVVSPEQLASLDYRPFFHVHPSQCAMMMEKAKLAYFTVDPVSNPTGIIDLGILLNRIRSRTAPFVKLAADSALAAYYNANEKAVGAFNAIKSLSAINAEADRYLTNLQHGLDFFGHQAHHVPLASLSFYYNVLQVLLDNFKTIEDAYQNHFTQLAQHQQSTTYIKDARNQIGGLQVQTKSKIAQLGDLIASTATIIDGYQAIIPAKRKAIDDALKQFKDAIPDEFKVNGPDILNSFGMVAFAPESSLMYLAQTAQLTYTGATKITDDQGVQIRKEYLIHSIQSVGSTIDELTEGYRQLNDGTLVPDDPGAGLLVANAQTLLTMLDGLYEDFSEDLNAVKIALEDFISTITERNNQILTYNAAVNLLGQNRDLDAQLGDQTLALNDEALGNLQGDLPALTVFISNTYYSARSQVMEILDLTARAQRFWALDDENILATAYSGQTPPEIDHATLIQAQSTLFLAYALAVETMGNNSSSFPADDSQQGIAYPVKSAQVEYFRSSGQLIVTVPPALNGDSIEDNPFAGKANVRVNEVRVWIRGATTHNGKLQVTITHNGAEEIVNKQNLIFEFSHDSKDATFSYDLTNLRIEEHAYFGVPNIPRGSWVNTDGSFNIPAGEETYAAVGPFTSWSITVDETLNPGLNLAAVTSIELEFHGTHYNFS